MTKDQAAEVERLESEARAKAAKHVANMLARPDQLEKVHQLTWRVSRKKASVEAMLKTAMQSQLDGVRTGLNLLERALQDISEIKGSMTEMEEALGGVPQFYERLRDVREENLRHSQLATAKENLRHIFTVPETVARTQAWIEEGKLLQAHQSLVDLENSRDDLLFELHRLGHNNTRDRDLLKEYFEAVDDLSIKMEKQLGFILLRAFATVRKNPRELVTALRIIEREERSDEDCLAKQKQTGFLPPGRPKQWRMTCMAKFKQSVEHKMEGNQLEDRGDNKMWLVRHLEVIRMLMLEDLRIAQNHLVPVFPPRYNIAQHCISLYHSVVSARLENIIEEGLEGQEYVTVLQWVLNTYPGPELMGSTSLNLEKNLVPPLLTEVAVNKLTAMYLGNMRDNYNGWMTNTIKSEKEDWSSDKDPEMDFDGFFHTSSPVIIYQMVDENLQVSATISQELVSKVMLLGIEQVTRFGHMYRAAVQEYKASYFKERSSLSQFTRYMIAIINNCDRFEVLSQEMKSRWWKPGYQDQDGSGRFELLLKTFQEIRVESVSYLLDEAFLDIEAYFSELFTAKWQTSNQAIDTICATLNDYFEDYQFLKPSNFELVITTAQDRVARKYITAMLQNNLLRRKISFTSNEERRSAASKIKREAAQAKSFFKDVAGEMADFDSPFDTVSTLAEVLASDEEMLSLELGTLCKRYPDVSHEQILCLLLLRADLPRNEAKQLTSEFVAEGGTANKTLHARSILSQVVVTSSLTDKLNPFAKE